VIIGLAELNPSWGMLDGVPQGFLRSLDGDLRNAGTGIAATTRSVGLHPGSRPVITIA